MPAPGWDHVLYVLGSCVDGTSCTNWVDSGDLDIVTTTSPQTFYIAVDGYSPGASGAYSDLLVTCPLLSGLDCTSAPALPCDSTVSGDTIGDPNDANQYAGVNGTWDGSEEIWEITLTAPTNIDIYLENHPGRQMALFLLDSCNVNNVVQGGLGEIHENGLPAGTYWVVVDGENQADNGAYDLRLRCSAPGTVPNCGTNCTDTLFQEDFGSGLPGTWSVVSNGNCAGPAATWTDANPGARTANSPITDPFMIVDSDFADICDMDERLESPIIDATVGGPFTEVHLTFDHYFNHLGPEQGDVLVRSSATAGWQTVASYLADSPNPEAVDIDISALALGQTDVEVAFHYYNANYEWYWMVDNVSVCGVGPSAAGLDCSAATPIACNETASGDTSAAGLSNAETAYSCGADTYDGNEQIFELTLATDQVVQFDLDDFGSRELDLFVLSACSPCSCVGGGGDSFALALTAGTYYLVVDGFSASDDGPFDLTVQCTSCVDPGFNNRWDTCENLQTGSPLTYASTSALEWNLDDCDYCRDAGNGCFSTPCTFDMYIVAECGTQMHMPLYDNETGDIQIYDLLDPSYPAASSRVYLYAQSTGGWSDEGYRIAWQDCSGVDPNWNDETTDIWFDGSPTLCGVYRAEFTDWGGFIWDLFSNCTGADSPGFRIYDNYCEALAAYSPKPALSVESLTISGTCPNYTVDYEISNSGCAAASTRIVVTSDLGGSVEQPELNILPGETRTGSMVLSVQNSGTGTITAYADFYDATLECQEAGSSAVACSISGGAAELTQPVVCDCVIPQFSNVQVEDLTCPVGIRVFWSAATFPTGSGHYDIYRSVVSFADALLNPPVASNVTGTEFVDNSTTPGNTYFYVVRAEDDAPAPPGCQVGPHGGVFTDVNVGPITDNLSQTENKPLDIGADLRAYRILPTEVNLDWSTVVPDVNTTHWHVYRATDPSLPFPDFWSMICPDKPTAGWLAPSTTTWNDTGATGPLYYYDVRSANDCEDISPGLLSADVVSTAPSCDGSGQIDFTAVARDGVPPFSYDWDFGDGSPASTLQNPTHTYGFPPYSHIVTLTVTDSTVPTPQVAVRQVEVGTGTAVAASFSWSALGLDVTFTGLPAGGTGSYTHTWDFGDGSGSSLQNPVHSYAAPGTYAVTYQVLDSLTGCQDVDTQDVTP